MSQQINLFNPALIMRKDYFNTRTMLWLILAVAVLMLGAYSYARQQTGALQVQREQISRQLQEAQQQLVQVSRQFPPRQPSKALQDELAATESRLESHERLLSYLQEDSSAARAGFSDYMRAFAHQGVNGVWLTGFVIDAETRDMTISGNALQPELVPQYIAKLGAEPMLKGRTFAALNMGMPEPDIAAKRSNPVQSYVNFMLQSTVRNGEARPETPEKKL
jgi:hypothetical protein